MLMSVSPPPFSMKSHIHSLSVSEGATVYAGKAKGENAHPTCVAVGKLKSILGEVSSVAALGSLRFLLLTSLPCSV